MTHVTSRLKVIIKELELSLTLERETEVDTYLECMGPLDLPLRFEHNKGLDHLCISNVIRVPLSNRERLEFHLAECQLIAKYQGAAIVASSDDLHADFLLEIYANVFLGSMSYESVLHCIETVMRSREAIVSLLDPVGLNT